MPSLVERFCGYGDAQDEDVGAERRMETKHDRNNWEDRESISQSSKDKGRKTSKACVQLS